MGEVARQAASLAAAHRVFDTLDLPALCSAGPLGAFWPLGTEIDCRPILERAFELGIEIGLPVVVRPNEPLIYRRWCPGDTLEDGPHNTKHPGSKAPEIMPSVLLLPLLSFTRGGYRLGYGGGYFDRTLQMLRKQKDILAVGLAFAAQEVAKLPIDPHDQPLDWVITEKEAIDCRRGAWQ